ncbi:uncharacterized protein BP5553_07977 [Venustampulla echinocandica]|uniref:Zn(2)-C6 fungal-type domain-containing protein n=1 Tax=Venustampulla echinocandica TaxID=2656787 RepID=A0A370TFD0_9HELO|nr:uncharacterized protein BP5553_07977 [Venustampulla echinocandica]RDL33609.1 hypothetical protein BP5553_07977 [Venustampulla echinocandica]
MTSPNDHNHHAARAAHATTYPLVPVEEHPEHISLQSQPLSSASSYADLNYLFGTQDPAMLVPKPSRNRRKSTQGSEHTKHRRTRSGCYTCRSRRVKCDEARPICERCSKGSRDCVYPQPPTSSKASGSGPSKRSQVSTRESPGSSSDEFEDADSSERQLAPIPDEDGFHGDPTHPQGIPKPTAQRTNASQPSCGPKSSTRNSSEAPSLVQDKGSSPTPSTEGSVGYSSYKTLFGSRLPPKPTSSTSDRGDWSYLPQDLRFYLTYFCENITHHHYSLKYDAEDFMRTRFLDIALENEGLLYAIVGFSAFQHTLHHPGRNIQGFLQYYNKSVSLLLRSLKRGERHNDGTLLAILQLATIEEFLGDWINLLGHQKAAYQILTELYMPETVMQDETSRIILGWYMRFDVFAGLMGGFETVLSRDWFSASFGVCQQIAIMDPTDLDWKIETALAHHRLIATDMTLLFARMSKGELSMDRFLRENADLGRRIEEWESKMDPALKDSRFLITDFTGAPPRDPDDIVDPYAPGLIYSGPLWAMNMARIDWLSIDLMHTYQTALTTKSPPSPELMQKAYRICQLFEAMELWPGSVPGAVVACQASLGISCLFLPKDERHSMWARRKLATIESHGYIFPHTFRSKMADLFGDRSCMHWWLPNEERYPPIIRSIRKFVEERSSPAKDVSSEDLRDMKAIFATMKLDEGIADPEEHKGTSALASIAVATTAGNVEDMTDIVEADAYSGWH